MGGEVNDMVNNELRESLPKEIQLQIKIVEDPEWAANEIERLTEMNAASARDNDKLRLALQRLQQSR